MEVNDVTRADVAILGAGPAGSTLAAILASRGVDTLLIDRDTFPRDKLCGEFLSYDALPVLDAIGVLAEIDARNAPRITHCRVLTTAGAYDFPLPLAARGISRVALDDLLFRKAGERGARTITGWSVAAADPAARTIDLTRGGAETQRIEARVIVGAWGRWGRLDRQLGRAFAGEKGSRYFGFKRHYRKPGREAGVIELLAYRDGYLGVNDVESGETNICGLVHQNRLTGRRGGWESFITELRDESRLFEELFGDAEPAQGEFLSSEPVIFAAREPVESTMFLVGDAAGIIDPLAGNGMAMAIQSAALATPYILSRLAATPGERPLKAYAEAWHEAFDERLRWSRRVAALLCRPALLRAAVRAMPLPAIGASLLRRTRARDGEVEALLRAALPG